MDIRGDRLDGGLKMGDDHTLRLWDLESGQTLQTLKGGYSNSVSADGRHALSGSYDNTPRLWDFGKRPSTAQDPCARLRSPLLEAQIIVSHLGIVWIGMQISSRYAIEPTNESNPFTAATLVSPRSFKSTNQKRDILWKAGTR